jgi:hypothetical protein
VNLFIQESAERDILRQVEWYAEKGVPASTRLAACESAVGRHHLDIDRRVAASFRSGGSGKASPMTEFDWLYLVIMPLFVPCVGGLAVWAARFIP